MTRWVSVTESQAKVHPRYGIKGTAALFRAMLVITPSLWLLTSIGDLTKIINVRGSLTSVDYFLIIPPIIFFFWSGWNAHALGKGDRRFFLSFYVFLALGPVMLIVSNLLWMTSSGLNFNMNEVATNLLAFCAGWTFWSTVMVAYLRFSSRINVTLRMRVRANDPILHTPTS